MLLHTFQDFLSSDFTTIAKFDDFSLPTGIQLYDPAETNNNMFQKVDDETNMSPEIENLSDNFPETTMEDDTNLPPQNFEIDDEIDFDPEIDQLLNVHDNEPFHQNLPILENENENLENQDEPNIQSLQTDDDTDDEPELLQSIMTRSRARAHKNKVHFAPEK